MYPEYLMHFGVKGMRWGVRKKREPEGPQDKSKKRKRALAIAGGVAGAALATAGGIAAYKNRGKILSGIAKKTNADRIAFLSHLKDTTYKEFSNAVDEYLENHSRAAESFATEKRKELQGYESLLKDLKTKPMSKKKYNAGLAFVQGILR